MAAYHQQPTLDNDELIDPDDGATLDDFDDPLTTTSSRQPLTGVISSTSSARPLNESYLTAQIPGQDRVTSQNTIDESVWDTLRRDLLAIWIKMREVLYPRYLLGGSMFERAQAEAGGSLTGGLRGAYATLRSGGISAARQELSGIAGRMLDTEALTGGESVHSLLPGLRDWDLWGPLIFCLLLSLLLSFNARPDQKDLVFSGIFAIVWIGEAAVTVQIRLLGGNIICIIGYTLFPMVIAAMLSAIGIPWIAKIPVYFFLVGWSMAAGISILSGSGVVKNRVGLAVFPLFLFYLGLGCLCFIS